MPKKENYILIHYCQWVHVEKRERRVIYVEKHNINAGNSTGSANIKISDYSAYGFIANSLNYGDSEDCCDDAADGLIATAIDAGDLTDCADITILYDASYGFIATVIDAGYLTDCSDDAVGGLNR